MMMKVYLVFWSDTWGDWELAKVFSTEEKAKEWMKVINGKGFWILEREIE
jgi:hypothetical protein